MAPNRPSAASVAASGAGPDASAVAIEAAPLPRKKSTMMRADPIRSASQPASGAAAPSRNAPQRPNAMTVP